MILTIQRSALLNACQIASAALPVRTTMPVYMNLKAIAEPGKLTLMATDLEIGVRLTLDSSAVKVEEPGTAILPASKLSSILRESRDAEIDLNADQNRVTVKTSASNYEMPGECADTFADVPNGEHGDQRYEMAAGDLQVMIRRTVFAAAKEEGKYAMRGVLWDMDDTVARLVATDGKRLAVATGACMRYGDGDKAVARLVPPKAMNLLDRLLADGSPGDPVQIFLRTNDALFCTEKATVHTRLVEGRFPSYRDVIPKRANAKTTLNAGEFLAAIRQAAIMIDNESKRITFAFNEGRVTLDAQGPTTGKSKVNLALGDYSGPPVTISFDPAYLTDFLKVVNGDEMLRLDLVDSNRAAVWRLGEYYLYLVVPLV